VNTPSRADGGRPRSAAKTQEEEGEQKLAVDFSGEVVFGESKTGLASSTFFLNGRDSWAEKALSTMC